MTKRALGQPEIERIIAENLTRGQIMTVFGVGEHAAQLARTQAMAIAAERERAALGGLKRPAAIADHAAAGHIEIVRRLTSQLSKVDSQLTANVSETSRLRAENKQLQTENEQLQTENEQLTGQLAVSAGDVSALRAENKQLTEQAAAASRPGLDTDELWKLMEIYVEDRRDAGVGPRIGTDRSKVTLFLKWLEDRAA